MASDLDASPEQFYFQRFTYPKPNLKDNTLDENNLERTLPLDNGRHCLDPKFGLGELDQLPAELLDLILIQVDLQTLTEFRRVNQRGMQVVDSIPEYKTILQHSSTSLRGALAIEAASLISCDMLYQTLHTAKCENCPDFGGFIYLLTCERVCFMCFTDNTKYLPLLAGEVKRRFGITQSIAANIIRMRSIPGCYSPNERICRRRQTLYDSALAREVGEKHHGSFAAMKEHVSATEEEKLRHYIKRKASWDRTKEGPMPRQPAIEIAFDGRSGNARRFQAIVRAPYINRGTKLADWGSHCVGCRDEHLTLPLHWRRKYSIDTFHEHISECGPIEDGKHRK